MPEPTIRAKMAALERLASDRSYDSIARPPLLYRHGASSSATSAPRPAGSVGVARPG
jgi:hypothetical protein